MAARLASKRLVSAAALQKKANRDAVLGCRPCHFAESLRGAIGADAGAASPPRRGRGNEGGKRGGRDCATRGFFPNSAVTRQRESNLVLFCFAQTRCLSSFTLLLLPRALTRPHEAERLQKYTKSSFRASARLRRLRRPHLGRSGTPASSHAAIEVQGRTVQPCSVDMRRSVECQRADNIRCATLTREAAAASRSSRPSWAVQHGARRGAPANGPCAGRGPCTCPRTSWKWFWKSLRMPRGQRGDTW